jgi:hypothetical protein
LQKKLNLEIYKRVAEIIDQIQSQCSLLENMEEELRFYVAEGKQEIKSYSSSTDYQEYQVVSFEEIASPYQKRTLDTFQMLYSHRIGNWLNENNEIIEIDSYIANIKNLTAKAMGEIITRPVLEYIDPHTYRKCIQKLWCSSSPWAKLMVDHGTRKLTFDTCLTLIQNGHDTVLGNMKLSEIENCQVIGWDDPYKILFIRLLFGFSADQLSRFPFIQLAFQVQAPGIRSFIVDEPQLFEKFTYVARGADTSKEYAQSTVEKEVKRPQYTVSQTMSISDSETGRREHAEFQTSSTLKPNSVTRQKEKNETVRQNQAISASQAFDDEE